MDDSTLITQQLTDYESVPTVEEIQSLIGKWAWNLDPRAVKQSSARSPIDTHNAGMALREIREQKLYRVTHSNFYLYCAERWGLTPARAECLMGISAPEKAEQTATPKIESHYVYFIRSGQKIKIGTTIDVQKRLATLQTGSPDKITLIGFIEGDAKVEKRIHKELAEFRSHGEWFVISPEVEKKVSDLLCQ